MELSHQYDAASYALIPKYPKKPSILKIIFYKLFRNIDLIECYRDEINKYWKEVR
jgi:hypothetical protein